MARERWTPQLWEEHGAEAIVHLVQTRGVVTWGEVEARISVRGWDDYRKVQPIQLSGALRRLEAEDPPRVITETTAHPDEQAVRTLRIPFPPSRKRDIERLRGRKRKTYLRYIAWAQDQQLCGRHGEAVVRDSLINASSDVGLWLPPQTIGDVHEVAGLELQGGQTIDMWAWIVRDPYATTPEVELPMLVEVKNKRHWLYADAQELWQLLVKAAHIAVDRPVLPVLACCWSGPTAWWMAYDVGFFTMQLREQVFSPVIDPDDFHAVVDDTGLVMSQHTGPLQALEGWLKSDLRKKPPSPPEEDMPWYRRQAERFAALAPHVIDFAVLAEDLPTDDRRNVFGAWRQRVAAEATWPLRGGW